MPHKRRVWPVRIPVALVSLLLVAGVCAGASSASARSGSWRVIARGGAVATVHTSGVKRFAVRVRVAGEQKQATITSVVSCSAGGPGVTTKRAEFDVRVPGIKVLPFPFGKLVPPLSDRRGTPICAVSVFAWVETFFTRGYPRIEILAPRP